MFEDRTISVLTYNKETLLAEKMQTIINRGIANTRLRDFYDVYSIMNFYGEQIEKQVLYVLRTGESQRNDGRYCYALENIHTVVHPALQLAVRDGLIVNNPSDSAMAEIKRSKLWDAPKRRALTIPRQKAFMNYLESDREYEGWLPIITVLLGTGMRIGECIAIRWEDLDFENRMISVNHNLSERPDSKRVCAKHIQTPKTEAGTRTIPMIQEVFEAWIIPLLVN